MWHEDEDGISNFGLFIKDDSHVDDVNSEDEDMKT